MTSRVPAPVPRKILFLTRDPELLRRQLAGEQLEYDEGLELLDDISTDEIAPAQACYYYDERLAGAVYTGLRGDVVPADAVRGGSFGVVVSGRSKGCGSSREAAPYAEMLAGIRVVIAASVEKIYRQNCENIGLLVSTDLSIVKRIQRGEPIYWDEFVEGLDAITREVVAHGGLFEYSRRRFDGGVRVPTVATPARPMTLAEKVLAAHAVNGATGELGVSAVAPGDAILVRADVRFSHEYVTAMADAWFRRAFGEDATIADPDSVILFRDHLTLVDRILTPQQLASGLGRQASSLAGLQRQFAARHGLRLYDEIRREGAVVGSEGICHNKIIEEIARPGQLVVGTDSHSCTAGAVGALAFGVGTTDIACAWYTRETRVTVPSTVRIVLRGRLLPWVSAKDVMLQLLSMPFFRDGGAIGKVLEFCGDGIRGFGLDERATLSNMSVEGGAFTGIIEPDDDVLTALATLRHAAGDSISRTMMRSDAGARYADTLELDLSGIEPMVATPGDPKNGTPLSRIAGTVDVDIAYGGSCAGAKRADMDAYAAVLRRAVAKGRKVAPGVRLYIQFGSQDVRRYAEAAGYLGVFIEAGAILVEPSCGACIRAGPGVSERADQVTISAANRNYPGRSGPGRVYLASPAVVAASAICGKIARPEDV